MRSPEQLLTAMQENKARRIQELERKEKSQLIKLIERLGHFDTVNEDMKWLQKHITNMEAK